MITTLLLSLALIQDPRVDLQYANHTIHYAAAPMSVATSVNGPIQIQNSTYTTQANMTNWGYSQLVVDAEPISSPNYDKAEFNALFNATLDTSISNLMVESSDCYYKTKFFPNGQTNILRVEYYGNLDPSLQMYSNFQVDWNNDGIVDYTPQRTGYREVTEIQLPAGNITVGVWYLSNRSIDPAITPNLTSFENLQLYLIPDTKSINTGARLYNDAELVWHRFNFTDTIFEPLYNTNPVFMVVGTSLNPFQLQPGVILQPNADVMVITTMISGRVHINSQLIGMLPNLWIQGVAFNQNGYEVGNVIQVQ